MKHYQVLIIIVILLLLSGCVYSPWKKIEFRYANTNSVGIMSYEDPLVSKEVYPDFFIDDIFIEPFIKYSEDKYLHFGFIAYSNEPVEDLYINSIEISHNSATIFLKEFAHNSFELELDSISEQNGYYWGGAQYDTEIENLEFNDSDIYDLEVIFSLKRGGAYIDEQLVYRLVAKVYKGLFMMKI